jgi:sulfate/thiosulfate-binding protein
MKLTRNFAWIASALTLTFIFSGCSSPKKADSSQTTATTGSVALLNVSYDPTRELYQDYNQAFAKYWQAKSGQIVAITQSHGGSGKQAQAVKDGLAADVITLGIASDIDMLAKSGLVAADWPTRFPNGSAPYSSTIVFLVRKGNPKGIKDWPDLVKPGVAVVTPNPKSSSGGRWNYLAAWGYALQLPGGNVATAQAYVARLYKNVPILDSGARGATVTFTQRHVGDVLLAWENEAYLATTKIGKGQYDIVYPSVSILAEPPVAVVDKNADAHKTRDVATEYLKYLYSPEGQEIAAKHYYRPRLDAVAQKYANQFPPIKLFTAEKTFGGWDDIQKTHFANGGVFDQIYAKK